MDVVEPGTDIDAVLAKPLVAHLATSSADGARHSPVWFLWEEGAMWLVGTSADSFPRRLREDRRCAIGVVDFDLTRGVLVHVGLRGEADVVPSTRTACTGCSAATWAPTVTAGTSGSAGRWSTTST